MFDWASSNDHVVFTNDLDFGALLAATGASRPSVIQVRGRRPIPRVVGDLVIRAINEYQVALREGAMVVVDETTVRVRVLPFH